MNITLDHFEFFLALAARISGFIFAAPFFSLNRVPQRVKILLTVGVSFVVYLSIPYTPLEYEGILGYSFIIVKEAIGGLILGLFAQLAYYILAMAGQMMDMQIGLSNMQELDPTSNMSVTISSVFLNHAISLMLIVTDMHLIILKGCIDSFSLVPVGGIKINGNIFQIMATYMLDYMIISFRIVLPVFAAILIVNSLLAILAKAAPQMNMFVIGYQLKIIIGLAVLIIIMMFLPSISDMIFNKMIEYMRSAIDYMGGGNV